MKSIALKIKVDDVIYENATEAAKQLAEKHKINFLEFCEQYMFVAKKHEIELPIGNIITTMELCRN
jgi:hypothetical protein